MRSRTTQFALNAAGNYLRFAVSLASVFFLTPRIIEAVGKDDYGLWTLVNSALGILGLLDLGFGNGIVKYTAECKGSGDLEKRDYIVSTLFIVYSVLSVIGTILVAVLAYYFTSLFDIPVSQHQKAIILLWIVSGRSVIAYLPLSLFRGVLFGEQKIFQINLIQILTNLVNIAVVIAALKMGYGIIFYAIINFAIMLSEHLLYIVYCKLSVEKFKVSVALFRKDIFREVFSFSSYSFLISVSALVLLRTDPLIVKCFMPLSEVTIYSISMKIAENALLLIKQYVNILGPLVAELKGSGDEAKIRFIFTNCAKFAFAPAALMASAAVIFSADALSFWVGKDFAAGAVPLIILMWAMALSVPQMVSSSILGMTGEHRFTAMAAMKSIGINIVASVILAGPLKMSGVALGTMAAVVSVDLLIVCRYACRLYKVPFSSYAVRVLFPGMASSLIFIASAQALKSFHPPSSLLEVFLEMLVPSILFALFFYYFFVEESEKALFRKRSS
ncbi:MAG: polysaccharide biosynthesis C-terminal domain-containing protein [Candidatus Riflebacteria bacterium]|nr:polysaccharide biosynthesis C-terminal domain-containing protein [Candidatus Riflebacteria bacterium]